MTLGGSSTISSISRSAQRRSDRTRFVGRADELRKLAAMVPRERLITLVGAGGVGKTRLIREAIPSIQTEFPGGVELVELAALDDPSLVLLVIAGAVGVSTRSGEDPLPALAEHFESKTLVVLDSFERLIAATPRISEILDACPQLHLVVTSRVALRIAGERELAIGPLAIPPSARLTLGMDDVWSSEALTLLVDRAAARGLELPVAREDLAAAVEICRRLGGWPLAIELAAARVKILGLRGVAKALSDPLTILGDGAADGERRHRTISDAIGWSYDLLTTADRKAFMALSAFAGGFTLDAAAHVAGPRDARDAIDTIGRLVDQSLLDVDLASPTARFSMLEPVREFAASRLSQRRRDTLARRHLDYFIALAEREALVERADDQASWLGRMTAERDNVRQALTYARGVGDTIGLLRLVGALERRFWIASGDLGLTEARAWLESAIALGGAAPPNVRAGALMRLAWAIDTAPQDVLSALERALVEYERAGDRDGQIEALSGIATVAAHIGLWAEAERTVDRAFSIRGDQGGRPDLTVELLIPLGQAELGLGRAGRARELFEEAVRVARESADDWGVAYGMSQLSQLALIEDRPDAAERFAEVGRDLSRRIGDLEEYVAATAFLATARLLRGDAEGSRALILDAAAADSRVASRVLVLDVISLWLSAVGQDEAAAVCLGVAERFASDRITRRRSWIAIRAAVEPRLRPRTPRPPRSRDDRGLSLNAAITFGLDLLASPVSKPPANRRLSAREQEVLAELVKGRSDAEIAADLFISKKTVSVHISRIRDKLGADSRVGIVLAALRSGSASATDAGVSPGLGSNRD
jgi:predicted ATPase/DNA-binding CsgD family transcriptional regulator